MINEEEKTWKEKFVTSFRYCLEIFLVLLRKTTKASITLAMVKQECQPLNWSSGT
jgi:hypothetical protein